MIWYNDDDLAGLLLASVRELHSTGRSGKVDDFKLVFTTKQLTQVLHQHLPPMFGWPILVQKRFERVVLQLVGQTLSQRLQGTAILGQAMVTTDEMLQQAARRFLGQLDDHFTLKVRLDKFMKQIMGYLAS
jgi:hypothetical protein